MSAANAEKIYKAESDALLRKELMDLPLGLKRWEKAALSNEELMASFCETLTGVPRKEIGRLPEDSLKTQYRKATSLRDHTDTIVDVFRGAAIGVLSTIIGASYVLNAVFSQSASQNGTTGGLAFIAAGAAAFGFAVWRKKADDGSRRQFANETRALLSHEPEQPQAAGPA